MKLPPRSVRRIAGPIVIVGAAIGGLFLLPALAAAAAVASIWLPGRWRGLRLLGFALVWLAVEFVALAAALALWFVSGFGLLLRTGLFQRAHYAVLRLVLEAAVDAAHVLFRLTLENDGVSWSPLDDGAPGSDNAMLVLSRHAGPGDSLLLVHTLMNRDHRRKPRIVLKDTLQLDPMIDLYMHRLPARFIDPTPTTGDDVERVIGELAGEMVEEDALLIFPEGGNFTVKRRRRAITRLRQRGHGAHADAAERMRHVLPPRPGGVIAAIEAAPCADVVFVAHTGLEHMKTVADVWRELPEDKTLQLRWWFIAAADVPVGRDAQIAWLFERWSDIDAWIAANAG